MTLHTRQLCQIFWNELKIDISRLVSHLSKMLSAAIDSTTMLQLCKSCQSRTLNIGYITDFNLGFLDPNN